MISTISMDKRITRVIVFAVIFSIEVGHSEVAKCYQCSDLNRENGHLNCPKSASDCGICMEGTELVTLSECKVREKGCLDCEYYNRLKNTKCPQNIKDCSGCLPGCKQSDDVNYKCVFNQDLDFLKQPTKSKVLEGGTVTFHCVLYSRGRCFWLKDDEKITIGGRYKYLSNGTKNFTNDCSIEIKSVKKLIDEGFWNCGLEGLDRPIISQDAILIVIAANITKFQLGYYVDLTCPSNRNDTCKWFRREQLVSVKDRYRTVTDEKFGKECKISIVSVREIDIGTWRCESTSKNEKGSDTIKPEYPIVTSIHSSDKWEDQDVLFGSNFTIFCQVPLGVNGTCGFQKDGITVRMGDRYKLVSKVVHNKQNCFLEIFHANETDNGMWLCEILATSKQNGYGTFLKKTKIMTVDSNDPSIRFLQPRNPENITVELGASTVLKCRFHRRVNCIWKHEGDIVDLHEESRSRFVDKYGMGKNVTDCSIMITSTTEPDKGGWICEQRGNSNEVGIKSTTIHLHITVAVNRSKYQEQNGLLLLLLLLNLFTTIQIP